MSRSLRFHPLDLAAAVAFLAYSSSAVVPVLFLVLAGLVWAEGRSPKSPPAS